MKAPKDYIKEDGRHPEPNFYSMACDILEEILPDEKVMDEKIFGYADKHNMTYNETMLLREMMCEAFRLKIAVMALKHEISTSPVK